VLALVRHVRGAVSLPIAVGFGIRTAEQAAETARAADAAVVGSALVERIKASLNADGRPKKGAADEVLGFVSELATGVRQARAR